VPRIELRLHRLAKLEVFSGSTPWDQRLRIISSMAITCSCIKSLKTFFESGAERATGGAIDATHARRSPPCRRRGSRHALGYLKRAAPSERATSV